MWRLSPYRLAVVAAVVLLVVEATQLKAKTSSKTKVGRSRLRRHLPGHSSMLRTLALKQDLLVCNAYPSVSPLELHTSGDRSGMGTAPAAQLAVGAAATANSTANSTAHALAGDAGPLPFKDCRYIQGRLRTHDRLDFFLQGKEVQASFEVGELPGADAVLLLVVRKREGSPMMSFQDYAFPLAQGQKDAQLAVIDAAVDVNSSSPHLKIEDHMTGEEKETVSKRVEQLTFNRVYSVEEGGYDASIVDPLRWTTPGGAEVALEAGTRRVIRLHRKRNYVLLRTGGDGFQESLIVYPQDPVAHSAEPRGAPDAGLGALCAVLAAVAARLAAP